ncbi:ferric reductase NAD binding domain-containing protein [Mycena sp. CBHHK59/15]|nr:ferric reductase NAD binding domain-containing protein [Mycena sp. CBHHK59/15]
MGHLWLDKPVVWHSSRDRGEFDPFLTEDQIALITSPFRNWYTADWDYGQTTVAFFCAAIGAAMIINAVSVLRARRATSGGPKPAKPAGGLDRLTASFRYLTSRQYRILALGFYAPPLAAIIAVSSMAIFTFALMLGPRPYHWPVMAMGMSAPVATRTGWMAIGIMPFMIAFATKVNLVSILTGTSHEKLQVYHRWAAVFMYITSLVHTFPFIVDEIKMGTMWTSWYEYSFYWTGVAALVPQTYLVALSWGIFRNPYYEFFKKMHYVASGIFMVALFLHVDFTLTAWDYFLATAAIYIVVWLTRVLRTLYITRRGLPASVTRTSPTLLAVSIPIPAAPRGRFSWAPGQHIFLRFGGLGAAHAFTSHPFTISSVRADGAAELVLHVHKGISRRMADKVDAAAGAAWTTRVVVDGPYGGMHTPLKGYDRVYLLGAGSGVTFTLPLLTDLAASIKAGDAACQHVEFVVAVRDSESYTWMADAVGAASALVPDGRIVTRVHVTGADGAKLSGAADTDTDSHSQKAESIHENASPSANLHTRPDLPQLVRAAAQSGAARVAVVACGPDEFIYDVRNSVAEVQLAIMDGFGGACTEMFLHTESYRLLQQLVDESCEREVSW